MNTTNGHAEERPAPPLKSSPLRHPARIGPMKSLQALADSVDSRLASLAEGQQADLLEVGKAVFDSLLGRLRKELDARVKEITPQLPEDLEARLALRLGDLLRQEVIQQTEARTMLRLGDLLREEVRKQIDPLHTELQGDLQQLRQDLADALEEFERREADQLGKIRAIMENLPRVTVNVPEQPPAQITVQAPAARPTRKSIEYDQDGRPQTIWEAPVE